MSGPITGDQYAIAAGPYAAVVTEQGAGLRALTHDERPLTLTYDADEVAPAACGQLLMPWPNRVDHGRYSFGGESHQLLVNETARDNAIHGLVRCGAVDGRRARARTAYASRTGCSAATATRSASTWPWSTPSTRRAA